MVIPIIIPMPMPRSSEPGVSSASGSYRTPIMQQLKALLKDIVTTRKSPKRLARKMLKKAARQLTEYIKDDKKHSRQRNWRYCGSFDENWVNQSVRYAFPQRNEAFELFKPLMKSYVFETYGIEVEVQMEILSSPWDSWADHRWTISPPKPQAQPKRFSLFRRRR